jgi:hypothetical protein
VKGTRRSLLDVGFTLFVQEAIDEWPALEDNFRSFLGGDVLITNRHRHDDEA